MSSLNKKNFLSLKENCVLNNLNVKIYNFGLSNSNYNSEIWYTDKNKLGGSNNINVSPCSAQSTWDHNAVYKVFWIKKNENIKCKQFA